MIPQDKRLTNRRDISMQNHQPDDVLSPKLLIHHYQAAQQPWVPDTRYLTLGTNSDKDKIWVRFGKQRAGWTCPFEHPDLQLYPLFQTKLLDLAAGTCHAASCNILLALVWGSRCRGAVPSVLSLPNANSSCSTAKSFKLWHQAQQKL